MNIRSTRTKRASFFGAALLAAGLVVGGVAPAANASSPIPCSAGRDRAQDPSSFTNGSLCLVSGAFKAVYQNDGNFVIYKNNTQAIWSTQTGGRGANRIVMQSDSNLVIYGSSALWQSGSAAGNRWNGTIVKMQSDGNLVVYGIGDGANTALWSSGTAGS